ncbi:MAG: tetratricopeptide repeat protein [Magnetococcales bacterium]|nr:tetratricopeptide repeat protein [Magnetococcales bacterium]
MNDNASSQPDKILQTQLTVDEAYIQALDHFNSNRLIEADKLCTAIIQVIPNHIDAINLLGGIAQNCNHHELAIELFQKAIAIDNKIAALYYNLGISLQSIGKIDETVNALKLAIEINPKYSEAYSSLGNALTKQGKLDEAILILNNALSIKHDLAEAHCNLGNALQESGRYEEAVNSYQQAIAINPKIHEAHSNLGNTLRIIGKHREAIASCKTAISILPTFEEAYNNLAFALQEQGSFEEAVTNYKKAITIQPNYVHAHSTLILCLDLFSDVKSDLPIKERENWSKQHADPLISSWSDFTNNPIPDRLLRIGYVGADFKQHSAAHIFSPMLMYHNPNEFQIFCYAGNVKEDEMTAKFKKRSTVWRYTSKIDDNSLSEIIRNDKIDILVDLAGHTPGNRLLTFARKPAPIQITAWGYPLGTGMKAMDYLFADPVFIPSDVRCEYKEQVVDIPCVIHLGSDAIFPDVTSPPSCNNGYITFGAFNRLEKYNNELYSIWSEILQRIPLSKLLIKTGKLDIPSFREKLYAIFKIHDIDSKRLILIGNTSRQDHLKAHEQIDMMLDPFPHNSGMTSMESLRMGVPVLSCGNKIRCPATQSMLNILNLNEWNAKDEREYVEKAIQFSKDTDTLKTLRHQLRTKFDESALGNSKLYAQKVEAIYRELWIKWCNRKK